MDEESNCDIRISVLGCFYQGKTTLCHRLLGLSNETQCTDGIDTSRWALLKSWKQTTIDLEPATKKKECSQNESLVSNHSNNVNSKSLGQLKSDTNVSLWDFAGQYIYYATHQIFLTRRSVYLLVFDLSRPLNYAIDDEDFPSSPGPKTMEYYLEFWMKSIGTFATGENESQPTVILVGTHLDKLQNVKDADLYFEAIRTRLCRREFGIQFHPENFALSLIEPSAGPIDKLRSTILNVVREQTATQRILKKWKHFQETLASQRVNCVLSFEKVLQIDSESNMPISDVNEIKESLKYFHQSGQLLYVDEDKIGDFVIVDPVFISNAFKSFIFTKRFARTFPINMKLKWEKMIKSGVLEEELLDYVWSDDPLKVKFKDALLCYLKHYKIIANAKKFNSNWHVVPLQYFIVPSLIKKIDDGKIASFLQGKQCSLVSLAFEFESEALIQITYHQITAGAIGTWPILRFKGADLSFENAAVYKMNHSQAGALLKSNGKIEILVCSLCPEEEVSTEMTNYLRGFVELHIGDEYRSHPSISDSAILKPVPFREIVKCYHKDHIGQGSIDSYDLQMLRAEKSQGRKLLCCPDHVSHPSLNLDKIFQTWFDYKSSTRDTKQTPKVKLSEKELWAITKAIGWEWEQLGLNLGLTEVDFQHIKSDNQGERMRIYNMLLEWKKQLPDEATLDVLENALKDIPPYSVDWAIIHEFIERKSA